MSQETGVSRITLKVSEASSRDVGKGLVRLDPKDMQQAGVSVGDIVLICGKRATAAKVMPAYQEARGQQSVQIDGLTRRNAGVGIGEKATLELASARPATRITLSPRCGGGCQGGSGRPRWGACRAP